jgi:hypothetical protein
MRRGIISSNSSISFACSENGFPLNIVRVRGQPDPYTQRKRDGAPLRTMDDGLVMGLAKTRPFGSGGPARAEITANTPV